MTIKSFIPLKNGFRLVRKDCETFNLFDGNGEITGVVVMERYNKPAYKVAYINRNASLVVMKFTNHKDALAYVRRNLYGLVHDTCVAAKLEEKRGR